MPHLDRPDSCPPRRSEALADSELPDAPEALRALVQEERRMRHESEHKRAEISDLNDLKSSMTALLCHELRGSLCVIAGFLDLAEEDLRDTLDVSTRELMQSASQQMDRLTSLLQELAEFSQMQPPDLGNARRAPLAEIVDNLLPVIHLQLAPAGLHLDVELDPEAEQCELCADIGMLLLRALLSNSRRFDPRPARVTLSARKLRWTLEIEIANPGAGLPSALRAHLGEGSSWGDLCPQQHGGGLPLGLWIARRATGLLGGALTMRTRAEPGIYFLVRLPLRSG